MKIRITVRSQTISSTWKVAREVVLSGDKPVFSWNRKLMGTFREEVKNKGEMAVNRC